MVFRWKYFPDKEESLKFMIQCRVTYRAYEPQ